MNIQSNHNQPSFGTKFIGTKAFTEVVNYAQKSGQLEILDGALHKLSNVKTANDILLIHGKTSAGVYSNFNMGKRAVQNLGAKTPEEASFNAILELAQLGRKFRSLVGGEVKQNLTAESVLKEYTSKISI